MPHIIRLRGPWEYEVLEAVDGQSSLTLDRLTGRVQMPCDWSDSLGADFIGRVRYRRRFNWTAPLEDARTVTLAIDAVRQQAYVSLNGKSLGQIPLGPAWFSIGPLLQPRNELVVLVECLDENCGPGGLTGEVRLEIE